MYVQNLLIFTPKNILRLLYFNKNKKKQKFSCTTNIINYCFRTYAFHVLKHAYIHTYFVKNKNSSCKFTKDRMLKKRKSIKAKLKKKQQAKLRQVKRKKPSKRKTKSEEEERSTKGRKYISTETRKKAV